MSQNIDEIMNKGYDCLVKELGIIGMEQFIVELKRQNFDYTAWRREYFDKMEPGQYHKEALEYAKAHPYQGKAKRI